MVAFIGRRKGEEKERERGREEGERERGRDCQYAIVHIRETEATF